MHETTIARNYAEALLALARKANDLEGWGHIIYAFAQAASSDAKLKHFLQAPQISASEKKAVLGKAFADNMPRLMLRFIQKLVDNRRQMLIPEIATEYGNLVDEEQGRIHARVTVARDPSDAELRTIERELSRAFGKVVVPHLTTNPAIIGGVVVRVGDTVLDGSVTRRLGALRQRMLTSP